MTMKSLSSLVFKKTVDGVLASFRATVADLRQITEDRQIEAAEIATDIEILAKKHGDVRTEGDLARSIADKLDAILS